MSLDRASSGGFSCSADLSLRACLASLVMALAGGPSIPFSGHINHLSHSTISAFLCFSPLSAHVHFSPPVLASPLPSPSPLRNLLHELTASRRALLSSESTLFSHYLAAVLFQIAVDWPAASFAWELVVRNLLLGDQRLR